MRLHDGPINYLSLLLPEPRKVIETLFLLRYVNVFFAEDVPIKALIAWRVVCGSEIVPHIVAVEHMDEVSSLVLYRGDFTVSQSDRERFVVFPLLSYDKGEVAAIAAAVYEVFRKLLRPKFYSSEQSADTRLTLAVSRVHGNT